MSKRQADYLSSILNDDTAEEPIAQVRATAPAPSPAPAPSGRPGMTLLGRESALARVAAGEVKQVTELLLDPARVRVWPGNPRHQDSGGHDVGVAQNRDRELLIRIAGQIR